MQRTYLEQDSPFIRQHHINWRLRSMHQASSLSDQELMFTCPVAVSLEDFLNFREELAELVKSFYKMANASPSDLLACFNLDWIRVAK